MITPQVSAEVTSVAADGTLTLKVTVTPAVPEPPSESVPVTVQIGAATRTLDAVNPTAASNPPGAPYPGARGPNQLVGYRHPALGSGANSHGWEASVGRGGLVERTATIIVEMPPGGWVLSSHGEAADWLRRHASVGAPVVFTDVPPPAPTPIDRASNIAAWVMMWPDSPRFDWTAIPDDVDELRLAFLINAGVPVGDGPWGVDSAGVPRVRGYIRDFLARRPGRFVSWSMGGGGYEVEIPSVRAYVMAVSEAERRWLPEGVKFGGANVDWESPRFRGSGDQIAEVLRAARVDRPDLFCSWSPNGSWKANYAAVCARNLDVVDALGFQCYDIPGLTVDGALKVYRDHFGADSFEKKLEVAYSVEPGRTDRWTIPQCRDAAVRMRSEFGTRRAAFWQAGRPELGAWTQAMQESLS